MLKYSSLLIILLFALLNSAFSTTYNVYNTSSDDQTQYSLPWAIAQAGDGDIINIRTSGTLTLSDYLFIEDDITINGPGANLFYIDCDGYSLILVDLLSQGDIDVDVSISGVTITNGEGNGLEETLGGGGGIVCIGDLTITDCTVNYCEANMGGGIAVIAGELTMTGCTIENNETYSGDSGGGIYLLGADAVIKNSTIYGNSDDNGHGGGIYAGCIDQELGPFNGDQEGTICSDVKIYNSTVVGNNSDYGGGIYVDDLELSNSSCTLTNTIVAGNTADNTGDDLGGFAGLNNPYTTEGYNIIGNNETVTSEFPAGSPNGNNDWVGTSASPLDPSLENSLAWNGGFTQTVATSSENSLPVNKIPSPYNSSPSTDQRGILRSDNGTHYDIGAFEYGDDGDNKSKNNAEDNAPNRGDGNYDGFIDSEQPHVATYRSGIGYVTVECTNNGSVQLHNVDEFTDFPGGVHNLPFNLTFFQIIGVSEATIKLIYHDIAIPNDMYLVKYNYLTGPNGQWIINIPYTKTYDQGRQLTILEYTVYDNGAGDIDNIPGVITDPAGGAGALYIIPLFEPWHFAVLAVLAIVFGIVFIKRIHAFSL